jgi:hypothetical protein
MIGTQRLAIVMSRKEHTFPVKVSKGNVCGKALLSMNEDVIGARLWPDSR